MMPLPAPQLRIPKTSHFRDIAKCVRCTNYLVVTKCMAIQQEASLKDNHTKKELDVDQLRDITDQLHSGRLSRRGLSERLKALGFGFGAAFVLGMTGAQASTNPDATVALKSTNPAINSIIQDGMQTGQTATDAKQFQQLAWFRRFFRRFFNRFYRRF